MSKSINYRYKYEKYKAKYYKLKGGTDKAVQLQIPFSEYKQKGLFYKKNIHKIIKNVKQPLNPPIYVNDIKGKMGYSQDIMFRTTVHLGQRKLFLTELQFLTLQMKSKDNKCYVIYAGAAPSNHTYLLKKFFPNIKFILVDPRSFALFINKYKKIHYDVDGKDVVYLKWNGKKKGKYMNIYEDDKRKWCNFIKKSDASFFLVEDFFTNDYAELFRELDDRTVYFWSDIRTADESSVQDLDVIWNLAQQYNWINILKPDKSMLKFRCSYYNRREKEIFKRKYKNSFYDDVFSLAKKNGIDFANDYFNGKLRYFKGKTYIQPFAPVSSTETRLYVDKNYELDYINCFDKEEKFMYFNNVQRPFVLHKNKYADEKLGFDHCADCAMEAEIFNKYINKLNNTIDGLSSIKLLTKILGKSLKQGGHGYLFEEFTEEWYEDLYDEFMLKSVKI